MTVEQLEFKYTKNYEKIKVIQSILKNYKIILNSLQK